MFFFSIKYCNGSSLDLPFIQLMINCLFALWCFFCIRSTRPTKTRPSRDFSWLVYLLTSFCAWNDSTKTSSLLRRIGPLLTSLLSESILEGYLHVYDLRHCMWGINMYLVCGETMGVSTLLARLIENCLSLFYYRRVDFLDVWETSQFWKELSCFFNYYPGGRYRKLAGTTTLAYRIVINCTTGESVLELVSTFRLACSSHRQETPR